MAVRIVEDSGGGMDMNALLLEVLNSNSSFGQEMRDKISSTLDVATKKIQKGAGAMKFKTEPVSVIDLIGLDKKEKEKISAQYKAQQTKVMKWIKEVAMASNWKNLRKGVNITDLLGADKIQNERFQKQYAALQKKILAAVRANIPTKVDIIPKVATSKAVEQPMPEVPEAVAEKPEPKFGIAGTEDKSPMLMPALKPEFASELESEGIPTAKGAEGEGLNKTNNLLESILEKMNELVTSDGGVVGADGGVPGLEDFQEKTPEVLVTEFGNEAIDQLRNALPGSDAAENVTQGKAKDKSSLLKTVLKMAGITALLGLVTYLAKNPEALEQAKQFFKEKFIPWLKDFVKTIPGVLENIGKFLFTTLPNFINDWIIQPIAETASWLGKNWDDIVDGMDKWVVQPFISFGEWLGTAIFNIWEFSKKWIIDPFINFGEWLGEATYNVSVWIKEKVIDPFIAFGEAVGAGAAIITQWVQDKVITPIKDFAIAVWDGTQSIMESIKTTILAIPAFIKDKFEIIKSAFIEMLNKIPGVTIGNEAKAKKIEEQIAKEEARIKASESGKNEYYGNEERGRQASREKIGDLKSKLEELNKQSDVANDFIWRPGEGVQKFSGSDVVIGAKDKIVVENKNMDEAMNKLSTIMNAIDKKFDQLIMLNADMLKSGGYKTAAEPLPPIPQNINTNRPLACDEALTHKTKVWELLHGVA